MRGVRCSSGSKLMMAWGVLLTTLVSSGAQLLTWLGILPAINQSVAYSVSAHGCVVVGTATTTAGMPHAFRWTAQAGMVEITNTLGAAIVVKRTVSPQTAAPLLVGR